MDTFEQFRAELRDALTHLHDPDHRPSELVCAVIGHAPAEGAGPVQSEIMHAIDGLNPPADLSPDARARRDFDLLYHTANCGLFDTIGHADYYLLHGIYHYGEEILNIHNGRLNKTIETAVRTSTGFEINTSYLRKGGDHFYPRPDFLKAIIEGGGIVNAIGSDAHRADDLGSGINEALKFLADHEIQFKPFYESD